MKIFIGADHRGFHLKSTIIEFLGKKGYAIVDCGISEKEVMCDYPKIAEKVALEVAKIKGNLGILICMTGIGNSIAANKIPGVRAALCYSKIAAQFSRAHNDANVLVLNTKFTKTKENLGILAAWLKTPFDGGRHLRRVNQIKALEKKYCHCKK